MPVDNVPWSSVSTVIVMATRGIFNIRPSRIGDLPRLGEIFVRARRFMAETGNPDQWVDGYPSEDLLHYDISHGDSYVVVGAGSTRVVGTFVLRTGDDPTYAEIDGAWLSDGPYATIHRIASSGEVRGVMHAAMEFARARHSSIRIDTHADNKVMQNAILKEGFRYCGIIKCWNGTPRLAYEYTWPAGQ